MKGYVRADIDGFFGLALDNLAQLLVIVGLCGYVLAFSDAMLVRFASADVWIDGAFALEQDCIFTAMILAALTVAVIERKFIQAAI